jgi:hypothetical protein
MARVARPSAQVAYLASPRMGSLRASRPSTRRDEFLLLAKHLLEANPINPQRRASASG